MITIYIATLSNLLWNLENIAVKRISRGTKCRAQTQQPRSGICVGGSCYGEATSKRSGLVSYKTSGNYSKKENL